jgi:radical SAM superfamily enzyme YgiQ (UPF0313 family)
MIIYIAELSHIGKGRSPNVVPLGAGYIAGFAKKHLPHLNITIFRDPDLLLRAIASKRPDIVGFSVHLWSERLSTYCAMKVKEISKNITVVAGGHSIASTEPELLQFMRLNPYFDVCIPNEGELGFLRLIEHVASYGKVMKDIIIDGCSTISSDGSLLKGDYVAPEVSQIPSPYLEGLLDSFLIKSYEPILSTMRGCPYSCRFCVSGTQLWSKLRTFDMERVFEEFDYIKKLTKNEVLIISDENFGINKRDVEIAEWIIRSYKDGEYPRRLYYYSAKIITDSVLKIIEILSPVGQFGMSFQTLDENVAKEMKRTNISYDEFLKYVDWAAERKIITSTEMIFGFPGETVHSYLAGIEKLIRSVDMVLSYNLRLFNGIDLATQENRDKYDFKTLFRLPERTYGCYDGNFVTETEEVVVGTHSFDYADYQKIRKYGLFLQMSVGSGYLTELIKIMIKLNLPGEKVIAFLTEYKYDNFPKLLSIVNKYEKMAEKELFKSPELCIEIARDRFSSGNRIPEVKLNLIFTGKIMVDIEARKELIEVIKEFIREHCRLQKQIDVLEEYLDKILFNKIVSFNGKENPSITIKTKINLDAIEQTKYNFIDDLLGKEILFVDYDLHEDTIAFLRNRGFVDVNDEGGLQDIYMSVSRFGLCRHRK